MCIDRKSTCFVLPSWNLVKTIISWVNHFHQVSWGLHKKYGFFTMQIFFVQTLFHPAANKETSQQILPLRCLCDFELCWWRHTFTVWWSLNEEKWCVPDIYYHKARVESCKNFSPKILIEMYTPNSLIRWRSISIYKKRIFFYVILGWEIYILITTFFISLFVHHIILQFFLRYPWDKTSDSSSICIKT